jgi:hypothetical protein
MPYKQIRFTLFHNCRHTCKVPLTLRDKTVYFCGLIVICSFYCWLRRGYIQAISEIPWYNYLDFEDHLWNTPQMHPVYVCLRFCDRTIWTLKTVSGYLPDASGLCLVLDMPTWTLRTNFGIHLWQSNSTVLVFVIAMYRCLRFCDTSCLDFKDHHWNTPQVINSIVV